MNAILLPILAPISVLLVILVHGLTCNVLGKASYRFQLVTGAIGVPVHELSHALVATLFGLKVDKIAFFQPDSQSGTLGYVLYRYNKDSILHLIFCSIVGIAPLITGLLVVNGWVYYLSGSMIDWINYPNSAFSQLFSFSQSLSVTEMVISLGVMTIGFHAIPSWADIRPGVKVLCLWALVLGILQYFTLLDSTGQYQISSHYINSLVLNPLITLLIMNASIAFLVAATVMMFKAIKLFVFSPNSGS